MINKVRNDITKLVGKKLQFRYNGSRNQVDVFTGFINACYNYIFIIYDGKSNRSFSYVDVIIGNLEIEK